MTPDGQDRTNVLDPVFTAIGLASAEAGYVTGAFIDVTGGR